MRGDTRRRSILLAALLVGPLLVAGIGQVQASEHEHTATDETIEGQGGTDIHITVFEPAGASAEDPVPVILHSHGWSGSRWTDVSQAEAYLDAGYGVVSIDHRGHGDSGGQAQVMDPDFEAEDDQAVIDHVAGLDWVQLDGPGDPVLGAIGGSYGGGYQFITALDETHETGDTRLDALSPDITWHDLAQSLAPNEVPRSLWVDALYWLAKAGPTEIAPWIDEAYQQGVVTGDVPEDAATRFYEHSPAWFVDRGTRLDVPTLISQGEPDNLFPLNQAVDNWQRTLTDDARAESLLLGHLTGHTLPSVVPPGNAVPTGNPCADAFGGMTELRLAFFDVHLRDRAADLPDAPVNLATEDGACVSMDDLPGTSPHAVGEDLLVNAGPAGAPVRAAIDGSSGPSTVSGIPTLEATVDVTRPYPSVAQPVRVFVGIAVGASPADARVLGNQWMPIQLPGPGTYSVSMDLAGVSDEVAAEESLYLVVSPTVDQFAHNPSRAPALVELTDITVGLPLVGPSAS